jgi:hypothetical protein
MQVARGIGPAMLPNPQCRRQDVRTDTLDRLADRLYQAGNNPDMDAAPVDVLLQHLGISWDELTGLIRQGIEAQQEMVRRLGRMGWLPATNDDRLPSYVFKEGGAKMRLVAGEWEAYVRGTVLMDRKGNPISHPDADIMAEMAMLALTGAASSEPG